MKKFKKYYLSDKEKKIVELISQGATDNDIAEEINIAVGTVRYYINKLIQKSYTVNRAHLVYWAIKEKIIR